MSTQLPSQGTAKLNCHAALLSMQALRLRTLARNRGDGWSKELL